MKISVIGTGNVGMSMAADLSIRGHCVTLVKTSNALSETIVRLIKNDNRVFVKQNSYYIETRINEVTFDLSKVKDSDVIIITTQSIYHEEVIKRLSPFVTSDQVVICICSYMSSFYFRRYCKSMPVIVESTGPYLEGRVELEDKKDEVVFRIGCILSNSPVSLFNAKDEERIMGIVKSVYKGYNKCYSTIECALQNPNMVLHTVGSIMSIPRIEFSNGNFCMYREAYSRKNDSTIKIMLALDEEKKTVIKTLGGRPIDIFEASGFIGDRVESFYLYSESNDRALSPTSVKSRYITEDVSQGLVLFESIAKHICVKTPIASSMIDIAGAALGIDFRKDGRTIDRLGAIQYIDNLLIYDRE